MRRPLSSLVHFAVLAVAFRPDGKELAVSTLNAEISFWDVGSAAQTGSVECRYEVGDDQSPLNKRRTHWASERFFPGDNSGEISFYQLEIKKHFSAMKLLRKYQISKSRGASGPPFGAHECMSLSTERQCCISRLFVMDMVEQFLSLFRHKSLDVYQTRHRKRSLGNGSSHGENDLVRQSVRNALLHCGWRSYHRW